MHIVMPLNKGYKQSAKIQMNMYTCTQNYTHNNKKHNNYTKQEDSNSLQSLHRHCSSVMQRLAFDKANKTLMEQKKNFVHTSFSFLPLSGEHHKVVQAVDGGNLKDEP